MIIYINKAFLSILLGHVVEFLDVYQVGGGFGQDEFTTKPILRTRSTRDTKRISDNH